MRLPRYGRGSGISTRHPREAVCSSTAPRMSPTNRTQGIHPHQPAHGGRSCLRDSNPPRHVGRGTNRSAPPRPGLDPHMARDMALPSAAPTSDSSASSTRDSGATSKRCRSEGASCLRISCQARDSQPQHARSLSALAARKTVGGRAAPMQSTGSSRGYTVVQGSK